MQHAVKHDFLVRSLQAGHTVFVYTSDHNGVVRRNTVKDDGTWTVTNYGIVRAKAVHLDASWIRWPSVFHVAGNAAHCIDWARVPRSLCDGSTLTDICDEYKRRTPTAVWFATVSVGPKPEFGQRSSLRLSSKLPPGWRIIQGGAV